MPKIADPRGNLTFIEEFNQIPFEIAHVSLVYDVPGGEIREAHPHKEQHNFFVALSGSFNVVIPDTSYNLNRSYQGVYLPPVERIQFENFSTNAVCLALSSHSPKKESVDEMLSLQSPSINSCRLIDIPNSVSVNGSTINEIFPFPIKRVYYLYDIPALKERGVHAHKKCHRFLIAISGAFTVELNDGENKKRVLLNHPSQGLLIPAGIWTAIDTFSHGVVCLSLASEIYSADDYIGVFSEYEEYRLQN